MSISILSEKNHIATGKDYYILQNSICGIYTINMDKTTMRITLI